MTDAAFIPNGQEEGEGPTYPTVFGLQFSPPVIGVLVAFLGLGAAVFLFINFVQPVLQSNEDLRKEIAEKKDKLNQLGQIQLKIAQSKTARDEAKQQLAGVTALFANQNSLNTLLFDLNKRIEARNSNLPPDRVKAKLTKFEPDPQSSGIVTDSSLGLQVNNKLYRQVFNVQLEGTFDQTRLFLIDLERQKSLSTIKELKSVLAEATQRVPVERRNGQILPIEQPQIKVNTSFKLQVLRPLTAEEQKLVAPAPTPAATPGAATSSPSPSPTAK